MPEDRSMMEDIERELFTKEELAAIVSRMGREISWDYKGKNLLLVSVLKGSVVFMSDLMRAISLPASIDFMSVAIVLFIFFSPQSPLLCNCCFAQQGRQRPGRHSQSLQSTKSPPHPPV